MTTLNYCQILSKLTALCSRSEHCKHDVEEKMRRWNVDEETIEKVLDYLCKEKYIDDSRYARFFINDKVKYNRWGRKKVEQALFFKHIPREVFEPLLDDIEDNDYEKILQPVLRTKEKSMKCSNDYERRMKLIRFAMGRGFSYEQAVHCLENL